MKKGISILLILLFFFAKPIYSQTFSQRVDSLKFLSSRVDDKEKVLIFDKLSRLFWASNPDSSLYFSLLALESANKTNDDYSLGEAYNSLGNAYLTINNNEEALKNYIISKSYREKDSDYLKLAYSLNNIALTYSALGMYTEAINAFKDAAALCEDHEDFVQHAFMLIGIAEIYRSVSDVNKALEYAIKGANVFIHFKHKMGMASAYNFIGSLHRDLNNVTLALEYFKKAYSIYVEEKDTQGISTTTNNLGIVYDELGENNKAIEFYNKSLEIARSENDKRGISTALNNIGFLYAKTKQYDKALVSYNESMRISREMYDYSGEMNTSNNIAWVYFNSGNIENAMEFVQHALSLESKNQNLYYLAESHEILSKIYLKQENYKKAFEHKAVFMQLKDSLFNIDRNEKLMEMQVRFETERKEKEIQLLKKNDEIRNLDLARQKNLQKFWIALSVMLVGMAILFFSNLQSKKKTNLLLSHKNAQLEQANIKLKESELDLKELNATKDRFFSIIAHDLKNPFNALVGFSELLITNFDKSSREELKEYIKIIHESSQNLSKLLHNLLQWSRTQIGTIVYKPELFPLLPLIHQEIEYLEKLAEGKNLKVVTRVENHLMVFADKNIISTVVRNLLSNAIKFSNPGGKIIVNAQEKEKMVEVSITDSGVGMNQDELEKLFRLDSSFSTKGTADEEGTGLGLLLCKEFVEKNSGSIWVTSEKDKGSTFSFTLPVHRWA